LTSVYFSITESFSAISPRITFVSPRQQLSFDKNTTGMSLLLACIAQSSGSELSYQWTHDSLNTDRLPLTSQGPFVQLQLESLSSSQLQLLTAGRLQCEAKSAAGSDRKTIDLQWMQALQLLSLEPPLQVIKSGQKGGFNCTVRGDFNSIHWFHNGRLLASSDSGAHPNSPHLSVQLVPRSRLDPTSAASSTSGYVSMLRLRQMRREHAGVYQCVVRAGSQSAQVAGRLLVEDQPPRLLEVFQDHQIATGSGHSLKCMAAGNPLPQIGWLLDEQPLDGAAPPARSGLDWQSLESGSNSVSSGPSSPVGSAITTSGTAISGQLMSQVRVGDYVTADNLVVSFVNISQSHTAHGGVYRCVAYSELGSVSHQAQLKVQSNTPFVRSMGVRRLLAGSSFTYHCPVSGWPIQQIQWFRGRTLHAQT
jgi:hypothetical protein